MIHKVVVASLEQGCRDSEIQPSSRLYARFMIPSYVDK